MKNTEKITVKDARSFSPEHQEDLRKKAVRAVQKGMFQITAAELFSVTRQAVGRWIKAYREGGVAALDAKRQGHPPGELLSAEQKQQIFDIIIRKTPDQYHLPYTLWTRSAVAELIWQRFGLRRVPQTIGSYLKQWGFTPQKPTRRAREKDPQAVTQWMEQEYPKLKSKARAEEAEIFWGDEMGLRSTHNSGTTYGRKGETPVIPNSGKRFGCNLMTALSNQGRLYFMVFKQTFDSVLFLGFLKRLIRQNDQKIFLIVDRHPVHRAQSVKKWVADHDSQISLFFLPSYSPELNPVEYLNQDVKSNAVGKKRAHNLFELLANIRSYLFSRQRTPRIVKNYFKEMHVQYALA
jgi:transposase